MNAVRTLIALDEGVTPESIRTVIPAEPGVEYVGMVEGLDESWALLQEAAIDMVVVACEGYSDRALVFIDLAHKQNAHRPIIVLCNGSPNGFVRRVFEVGGDDLVTLPETPDRIAFALQKAVARHHSAGTTSPTMTPVVTVLGPKGGSGKTLTAANLAVALAQIGKRTALVDLDLQFGDLALSLGLAPDHTIYDLAASGGTMDAEKVETYMTRHSSGVDVLLAPRRPDQANAVSVEFLRQLYAILRAKYDFVVVDTPPGFTPEVITSVDTSTRVCMVAMLDSLSLKNTKIGLETLDLMGYDRNKITLVLNRADARVGINKEDVVAIFGREPDALLPSDREIVRAVNEGTPIAVSHERSEAARVFRRLAETYVKEAAAATNGDGKAGAKRLLSWRKP